MAKIKTAELIGDTLDWAVAKAEGLNVGVRPGVTIGSVTRADGYIPYSWPHVETYSTDWAQGGPIIERERIDVRYFGGEGWYACCRLDENGDPDEWPGVTPLIAAMRCFVASRLGDTVDIPQELIG
jgi:hypothetical protein